MDEQLIALYHRHVGAVFDRQQRFAAFNEKKGATGEFEYDPSAASLSFGKLRYEAPILGTHSHTNNSWLWAWANKNLKLTLTNRALGDLVRTTAHRVGVHQLGAHGFALEPLLGPEFTQAAAHVLGVVLCGELGYDAYFAIPRDGATDLLLLRDDRLKFAEKHPLVRVATVFPEALDAMPVIDHKSALAAYAHEYGLTVSEAPGLLKITAGGKDELTATFDDRGRFVKFAGIDIPEPKPAKKPAPKKKPAKKPAAKKPAAKAKPAKKPIAAKPTTKKPAAKKAAAKKPAPAAKKPVGKKR